MAASRYGSEQSSRSRIVVRSRLRVAPNSGVVGWLLICLSLFLIVLFQPLWELGAPIWFQGQLATAPSENIDVRRMWFNEGRRGRVRVYEVRYTFQAVDGKSYAGVSYYADPETAPGRDRAVVEYQPWWPSVSRLQGRRVTPGGLWSLGILAPGLLGIVLVRAARIGARKDSWVTIASATHR